MRRRYVAATLAALSLLVATFVTGPVVAAPIVAGDAVEVIVLVTPGTPATRMAGDVAAVGGTLLRVFDEAIDGYTARVPRASIAMLRSDPWVRDVELNQSVSVADVATTTVQEDPPSWGLDRIDQRTLPLDQRYEALPAGGAGVTIYVVDTGTRLTQRDFTGRIRSGPDYIQNDGAAGDCNGHGTVVAGIAAGTNFGVAKKATVVPIRVFDCDGNGTYDDVLTALEWIVGDHDPDIPAVVNLSLSGGRSDIVDDAIDAMVAGGITVVGAAGNDAVDACTSTPAAADGAIAVGASTINDARAAYSNFGSCVDIFAPGDLISSDGGGRDNAVEFDWSGTSMAAPHVSGVAAMYLAGHPDATPAQVRSAVFGAATPAAVTDARSTVRSLVNVLVGTTPGSPTLISRQAGNESLSVQWAPPAGDGGYPVTSYRIEASPGGASVTVDPDEREATIGGLTNGTPYTITVTASNQLGWGAASTAVAPLTPFTVPGPPTTVRARLGDRSAVVSWAPPTDVGGSPITAYLIATSPGAGVSTVAGNATSATISGLRNGSGYRFTVTAVNAAGPGPASPASATVVPASVPVPGPGANLVPNTSFTAGVTGWRGVNARVAVVRAVGADGPTVARVTRTTGTSYSLEPALPPVRGPRSDRYLATAMVRSGSPMAIGDRASLVIEQRRPDGTLVGTWRSPAVALSRSFTTLRAVGGAGTAGAASDALITVRVEQAGAGAGDVMWVDRVTLAPAGTVIGSDAGSSSTDPNVGIAANSKRVSVVGFRVPVVADVYALRVRLSGLGATTGTQPVRGVLYRVNGSGPTTLVSTSAPLQVRAGRAPGWVTLLLPTSVRLPAGNYAIGVLAGGSTPVVRLYGTNTSTGSVANRDAFVGGASPAFGPAARSSFRLAVAALGG